VAATSCNPDSIPLPKAKGLAGAPVCRSQGAARVTPLQITGAPQGKHRGPESRRWAEPEADAQPSGHRQVGDPCFACRPFQITLAAAPESGQSSIARLRPARSYKEAFFNSLGDYRT